MHKFWKSRIGLYAFVLLAGFCWLLTGVGWAFYFVARGFPAAVSEANNATHGCGRIIRNAWHDVITARKDTHDDHP